jgi:hypothetical protein
MGVHSRPSKTNPWILTKLRSKSHWDNSQRSVESRNEGMVMNGLLNECRSCLVCLALELCIIQRITYLWKPPELSFLPSIPAAMCWCEYKDGLTCRSTEHSGTMYCGDIRTPSTIDATEMRTSVRFFNGDLNIMRRKEMCWNNDLMRVHNPSAHWSEHYSIKHLSDVSAVHRIKINVTVVKVPPGSCWGRYMLLKPTPGMVKSGWEGLRLCR